jgi:hypothetical protein
VNQIGNNFLACAAFVGDENRHVAGRDAFDGADDGLQRGALKHGRGTAAHGRERAAQGIVFFFLRAVFDGAIDRDLQRLRIERFVDEMIRAAFGRLHGGFKSGFAGEHDHFGFGPVLFDLRQEVKAVAIGQFQIEQHDVRRVFGKFLL